MAGLSVVGKSVPRVDAYEKVTGRARYCSDFRMPGMLFATLVKSPYAHARILRIDASEAEKLPGVRVVVLPEHAPDLYAGSYFYDEFVLPRDGLVRCIGQPIAIVVADTRDIAEAAVDLVKIDYEELPAVFDPEEALSESPPVVVHPEMSKETFSSPYLPWIRDENRPNCVNLVKVREGDVGRGFEEADLIVENRYSTSRIACAALETHRVDAWVDSDGTFTARISSQTPADVRDGLARLFGVSPAKVRVIVPCVGGGFGGKAGDDMMVPLAMLAAIKTRRPVRLENTRAEELVGGRHRGDVIVYVKDGVKKDGTLVARQVKAIENVGRHAGIGFLLTRALLFGAVGAYRIPNFRWDAYGVYTNNPIIGAFRGFGGAEVTWAVEQQMDALAEKLGMDPVEFRKKNILREGDRDVCGQRTVAIGVEKCLNRVARSIEWERKPRSDGVWKKGKGIAVGCKYTFSLPACVTVKVHIGGKVEVRHGNIDMGQGLNTVMAQIAAEEFRTTVGNVILVYGDTAVSPYDGGAVSSRSTFFTGNAVRLACQNAKARIFELASAKLSVSPDALDIKEWKVFVKAQPDRWVHVDDLFVYGLAPLDGGEITGSHCFSVAMAPAGPENLRSERVTTYYSYFAHAVEVAVNTETGEVKVLRIVGAADMGTPVNPKMAEGQIESGFGQGIGSVLYERIALENGVVTNPNFADYKIPTARDLPLNENAKAFLEPVAHPEGPFGAKGMGEGVLLPIAPAISNAVYNAVGIRVRDLPMSREKVLKALKEEREGDGRQ